MHQMSYDKKQSFYLVYLPACYSSNEWIAAVLATVCSSVAWFVNCFYTHEFDVSLGCHYETKPFDILLEGNFDGKKALPLI